MKIYKWVVIFKCQYCQLLLPLKSISKGGKSNSSIHGIIIFHFNFLCVTLFQVPHHASFSPIVEQSSQPQHQLKAAIEYQVRYEVQKQMTVISRRCHHYDVDLFLELLLLLIDTFFVIEHLKKNTAISYKSKEPLEQALHLS